MSDKNKFEVTTRDKVLRAYENSTELVRDFKIYSNKIDDNKDVSKMFAEFAEDEGVHAARLLEVLKQYEEQ